MKRCPVCGEMNLERNRFCGNCGAELGERSTTADLARSAEQLLYDLVKGVSRTFFELRDQLESNRWAGQGRGTVDQAMGRLKDAVDAGRREYEDRRGDPAASRRYDIPVGGAGAGASTPAANEPAANPSAGANPGGAGQPTASASSGYGQTTGGGYGSTGSSNSIPIGQTPPPAGGTVPPMGEGERPA